MTPTSTTAAAAASASGGGSSATTAAYLVAPTPHAASIDANSRRIALELAGSVMAMVAAGDWDDGVVGTAIEAAEDAPAGLFCTGYLVLDTLAAEYVTPIGGGSPSRHNPAPPESPVRVATPEHASASASKGTSSRAAAGAGGGAGAGAGAGVDPVAESGSRTAAPRLGARGRVDGTSSTGGSGPQGESNTSNTSTTTTKPASSSTASVPGTPGPMLSPRDSQLVAPLLQPVCGPLPSTQAEVLYAFLGRLLQALGVGKPRARGDSADSATHSAPTAATPSGPTATHSAATARGSAANLHLAAHEALHRAESLRTWHAYIWQGLCGTTTLAANTSLVRIMARLMGEDHALANAVFALRMHRASHAWPAHELQLSAVLSSTDDHARLVMTTAIDAHTLTRVLAEYAAFAPASCCALIAALLQGHDAAVITGHSGTAVSQRTPTSALPGATIAPARTRTPPSASLSAHQRPQRTPATPGTPASRARYSQPQPATTTTTTTATTMLAATTATTVSATATTSPAAEPSRTLEALVVLQEVVCAGSCSDRFLSGLGAGLEANLLRSILSILKTTPQEAMPPPSHAPASSSSAAMLTWPNVRLHGAGLMVLLVILPHLTVLPGAPLASYLPDLLLVLQRGLTMAAWLHEHVRSHGANATPTHRTAAAATAAPAAAASLPVAIANSSPPVQDDDGDDTAQVTEELRRTSSAAALALLRNASTSMEAAAGQGRDTGTLVSSLGGIGGPHTRHGSSGEAPPGSAVASAVEAAAAAAAHAAGGAAARRDAKPGHDQQQVACPAHAGNKVSGVTNTSRGQPDSSAVASTTSATASRQVPASSTAFEAPPPPPLTTTSAPSSSATATATSARHVVALSLRTSVASLLRYLYILWPRHTIDFVRLQVEAAPAVRAVLPHLLHGLRLVPDVFSPSQEELAEPRLSASNASGPEVVVEAFYNAELHALVSEQAVEAFVLSTRQATLAEAVSSMTAHSRRRPKPRHHGSARAATNSPSRPQLSPNTAAATAPSTAASAEPRQQHHHHDPPSTTPPPVSPRLGVPRSSSMPSDLHAAAHAIRNAARSSAVAPPAPGRQTPSPRRPAPGSPGSEASPVRGSAARGRAGRHYSRHRSEDAMSNFSAAARAVLQAASTVALRHDAWLDRMRRLYKQHRQGSAGVASTALPPDADSTPTHHPWRRRRGSSEVPELVTANAADAATLGDPLATFAPQLDHGAAAAARASTADHVAATLVKQELLFEQHVRRQLARRCRRLQREAVMAREEAAERRTLVLDVAAARSDQLQVAQTCRRLQRRLRHAKESHNAWRVKSETATREIEAKRMQLSQRNQELTHSLATRTRELEQTQRQLLQERSARQEAEAALKQASHSAEAHEALSARCDALEEEVRKWQWTYRSTIQPLMSAANHKQLAEQLGLAHDAARPPPAARTPPPQSPPHTAAHTAKPPPVDLPQPQPSKGTPDLALQIENEQLRASLQAATAETNALREALEAQRAASDRRIAALDAKFRSLRALHVALQQRVAAAVADQEMRATVADNAHAGHKSAATAAPAGAAVGEPTTRASAAWADPFAAGHLQRASATRRAPSAHPDR